MTPKLDTQNSELKAICLKGASKTGIQPLITAFFEYQLILPCQSPYNTPILPVKKLYTEEYWFVQDLRAIH